MIITLTWPEQLFAMQAGGMRRMSAMKKARSEPHGSPNTDPWGIDIEACGAESAVAKAVGRYWSAFHNKLDSVDGDVCGLEVRSTPRMDGRLIIKDTDKGESPYILVRGTFPVYDVVGWIYGKEGKDDKYLFKAPGREKAYYVPSRDLRAICDLPNWS